MVKETTDMTRIVRNERGIALAIAIFALVVVGALVAAAFFAGTQEQRLAENAKRVTQSFGVAETGIAEGVRQWEPVFFNQQPVYPLDSALITRQTTPARTGSYGGYVYKLNANMYLMDITGSDTASRTGRIRGGGARQRLGLITRVRPLAVDVQASLTTQGSVRIQGNGEVNGVNQDPAGWNCTGSGSDTMPDLAGIRNTGTVQTGGNGDVLGSPPVWQDNTVNNNTFTQFGDVTFDDLVARADVSIPGGNYRSEPSLVGGVCNRADPLNWGDGMNPAGACARYFPIIYVDGDVTLNGVQGQGILLVRGNVRVQGSYQFFGLTIIQGDLTTAGGGSTDAHFWGAVLARNADIDTQSISGNATLNYSSCAILTALQATGVAAPLRSRGWSVLY
jgi:hypothetical protein